jgi:hypothetical protein
MDDLAADAAQRWYDAAELFKRPSAAYRSLRTHLKGHISEEGEPAIAFQGGNPVVVLLHKDRFTIARPAEPASEQSPIQFDSIPLGMPIRVGLVVGEERIPEGFFRKRTWTLGDSGSTAIVLETRARTSRLAPEEIGGEALVAEAAARLGWPGREG